LHADEDAAGGARRELREEIGTDRVMLVKISEQRYCYEVPGGLRKAKRDYSGQCLRWVLAEMNVPESEIRFAGSDAEFDDFEWVQPAEALRRIVGFKKRAYRQAMSELGLLTGNEH
jgi:8-oxo-dGTP pyrophosphatase MutT (NUDIX family)